jgi:AcrR family transcriptional regulator
MKLKQVNTEQTILEAAEKLFVRKGYTATRTTEIAAAAGVNQALLHYYFRTKEALFERIFREKTEQMLDFFVESFDSDLPFLGKVRLGIERHFDFVARDPTLPFFILRELIQGEERKTFVREKIAPVAFGIIERMTGLVREAEEKGEIRPVDPQDLLLNIVSLNVFSFIALQLLFDVQNDYERPVFKQFLEQRKKNNVETIINSIIREKV